MNTDQARHSFLTMEQAKEEMRAMGIVVTDRQLRRWADKRVLPFFRFGRYLYIERNELGMYFWRRQLEAIRKQAR
jgi:hypothetical protein